MAEHAGTDMGRGPEAVPEEDEVTAVQVGDGWENEDGAARRPEGQAGKGVVTAFGKTRRPCSNAATVEGA